MRTKEAASNAQPRSTQAIGIETNGIILRLFRGGLRSSGVTRIGPGERTQQDSSIGNGSCHRSRGVLAVRNGDNSRPADQTERRFDANNPIVGGWRENGAIG